MSEMVRENILSEVLGLLLWHFWKSHTIFKWTVIAYMHLINIVLLLTLIIGVIYSYVFGSHFVLLLFLFYYVVLFYYV